jgi:hypothetical protein
VPAHQRTAAGWRAVPLRSAAGRAGRWRRRAALHRLPQRRRRRRVIRSRPTQGHPPRRPAPPGKGPGPVRRPQKGRPRGTRHGRGPRRGAPAPDGGGRPDGPERGLGPGCEVLVHPNGPEPSLVPARGALILPNGPEPGLVPARAALILPNGPEPGLVPARAALILPNGPEPGLVPACGTWWARRNRARRAAEAQKPGPMGRRRHEPRTGVLRRPPALPPRPGPSSPGGSRRGAVAGGECRGAGCRNRMAHRRRGRNRWPVCPRHSSPLLLHRLPPGLLAGSLPAHYMIDGRCSAACPADLGPCAADGRPALRGVTNR